MDDFTWSEVGRRLKDWRVAAGITQRTLSAKVGLSQPAIQAIEAGATNPQLNSLQRLASAFGRTTRELMVGQVVVSDPRVQRLERVLCSGNVLAIAAAEQGLTCAEGILGPSPQRVYRGKARPGTSVASFIEEEKRRFFGGALPECDVPAKAPGHKIHQIYGLPGFEAPGFMPTYHPDDLQASEHGWQEPSAPKRNSAKQQIKGDKK